jgi:hypothetical protein
MSIVPFSPCPLPPNPTYRQVGAYHQLLKQPELGRGPQAARVQHLRHLMAQLEGSALKAQVAARADLQDEPKVDVHDVAAVVQHDVAVVAVLGLEVVRAKWQGEV